MPYPMRSNGSQVVDRRVIYTTSYTTLSGARLEFKLIARLYDDQSIDIINTKTGQTTGFLPVEAAANLMKFLIKKMPLEVLGEL